MSTIHVFVSFDVEHDEELYELLLVHSRTPSSGQILRDQMAFTCCKAAADVATEGARGAIRNG